jgi:hypothetical protein
MIDTVVLFFVLGLAARLAKSELKLPAPLYEALSIYLLLAIGLKGGAELARQDVLSVLPQVGAVLLLGTLTTLIAYALLRVTKIGHADAASIAGHYGSVSVVTFAVAANTLTDAGVAYESILPLFLVVMEVPGIVTGILLARLTGTREGAAPVRWGPLLHEVFLGKGLVLLVGGLLIGWAAGAEGLAPMKPFFGDLFKGALCLFLLEMGSGGRGSAQRPRRTSAPRRHRAVFVRDPHAACRRNARHRLRPDDGAVGRWHHDGGHAGSQRVLHRSTGSHAHRHSRSQSGAVDHLRAGNHLSVQPAGRHSDLSGNGAAGTFDGGLNMDTHALNWWSWCARRRSKSRFAPT